MSKIREELLAVRSVVKRDEQEEDLLEVLLHDRLVELKLADRQHVVYLVAQSVDRPVDVVGRLEAGIGSTIL